MFDVVDDLRCTWMLGWASGGSRLELADAVGSSYSASGHDRRYTGTNAPSCRHGRCKLEGIG